MSGNKANLIDGEEDVAYTIKATDLLQGYTDVDGDALAVKNLRASNGNLSDNGNGTWTFTPAKDFNGKVNLNYTVTDGNGEEIAAQNSFSLVAVNDETEVSGVVDLGDIDEDNNILITSEQLLAKATDSDSDALSVELSLIHI